MPAPTEPRTSVYLVNAAEDEEPSRVPQRCFASVFEQQLDAWHRDPDDWPKRRTMATFREWFDAEIVHLVFDLGHGPIKRDD